MDFSVGTNINLGGIWGGGLLAKFNDSEIGDLQYVALSLLIIPVIVCDKETC